MCRKKNNNSVLRSLCAAGAAQGKEGLPHIPHRPNLKVAGTTRWSLKNGSIPSGLSLALMLSDALYGNN